MTQFNTFPAFVSPFHRPVNGKTTNQSRTRLNNQAPPADAPPVPTHQAIFAPIQQQVQVLQIGQPGQTTSAPAPGLHTTHLENFTRHMQTIQKLENEVQAFQSNPDANTNLLLQMLSMYPGDPAVKSILDTSKLIVTAAERQNNNLVAKAVLAGANINVSDAQGRTALRFAVLDNNTPLIQFLNEHGANPNQTPVQIPQNPYSLQEPSNVEIAAFQNNANAFKSLLLHGAAPFDRFSLEIPPERMRMFELMSMHLQLRELTTNGMSMEECAYAKKELAAAITPFMNPSQRQSVKNSLLMDQHLAQGAPATNTQILNKAIHQLRPGEFLWLFSPTQGHAINTVVRRNPDGGLDVTIANRGLGAEHHDLQPDLSVSTLTYRFSPEPGRSAQNDLSTFEYTVSHNLAHALVSPLPTPDFYKMWDNAQAYRQIKTRNEVLPVRVEKRHDQSSHLDIQLSDNCATMSMLAAVEHLFGDRLDPAHFQMLEKIYDQHLLIELGKFGFTPQEMAHIDHVQTYFIDSESQLLRGSVAFSKAVQHQVPDQYKYDQLIRCVNALDASVAPLKTALMLAPGTLDPNFMKDLIDRMHRMEYLSGLARVQLHRDFMVPLPQNMNTNDYLYKLSQTK